MKVESLKNFVLRGIRKYYAHFRTYTLVGMVFALLEIFFLWFFIDIMRKPTFIYSSIIVGILTIAKFYAYVFFGMMRNRLAGYILVLLIFYMINVACIWLLVTIGFSAAFSSAVLALAFFLLRFLIYDKLNLLKR